MPPVEHHRAAALDRLVWPTYAIAGLFVVLPIVDLITNVFPLQPSVVSWRYGAIGLASGFLLTPILGAVMLALAAAHRGHAAGLRILAGCWAVITVLLVGATVLFVLDALQLRGGVQPEELSRFDIGAAKAIGKNLLGAGVLAWLGWASVRAARSADRLRKAKDEQSPVVVKTAVVD